MVSRSPRLSSEKQITPFEAYHGYKPNIEHMKPFGCLAYVTKPIEIRRKLLTQPVAYKAILIGYTESIHQYRIWNIKARYVQLVRDVTFNEQMFPAAKSINSYKIIFPQKPLPEGLLMGIKQNNKSLDMQESGKFHDLERKTHIQPSLEPEKEDIDRQLEKMNNVKPTEMQNQSEMDIDSIVLEDNSAQYSEEKQNFINSETTERIEPEQVHMHGHTLVDDEQACMQNIKAPISVVNHDRTASEMIIEDLPTRKSERLKSKPRRQWNSRLHFARAAKIAEQNPILEIDPSTLQEALDSPFGREWAIGIEEELEALEKNKTWSTVNLPPGKKPIGNKWVFKQKINPDNSIRYKARLVAKGYEQRYGIDFKETFAPVVNMRTDRVLLALAAALDLLIHQMDVKTAFLNGDLEEEVYMDLPEGYEERYNSSYCEKPVLKLNKSLYGLKQAPRVWNKSLHVYLTSLGFKQSEADYALYIRRDGIIIVYVDDLKILARDIDAIEDIKTKLKTKYEMTDLGETKRFLGVDILRNREQKSIIISQKNYIEQILHRFGMHECKPMKTPLPPGLKLEAHTEAEATPEDRLLYQSMLGSIMYAMLWTRPDLGYAVSLLGRFSANPGSSHWNCMKHVLQYLKGTENVGIKYQGNTAFNFHGYSDSDWAEDRQTRRSTSGNVFMMAGGAISWASKRQATDAASSTEAEYIAAAFVAKEIIWLRTLLLDLEQQCVDPTERRNPPATLLYGDNTGSNSIARNPEHHQRTKHIDVVYHFILERVETKEINVKYISTADMTADILTKSLPYEKHCRHSEQMGLIDIN